jgi:hypothetical protein
VALSAWARKAVATRRHAADLRWRRPPQLKVHPAQGNPAIYYLAPHLAEPAGGVKVMYRQVDLLNEMGIEAAILHEPEGFRATWFANETRIVSAESINLRANDVLVIPECYGPGLSLLPDVRVYIFNQGAYHTFDLIDDADPYAAVPNLQGMLTVSVDSQELLEFAFPGTPLWRTRPVIDRKIFYPGSGTPRKALAFLPERRNEERHQLLSMLRSRGVDWDLVPISGLPETGVAELMRESAIFLSFSQREGFGLPPAEAMASGCYVIGYDGGGGKEFFDPAYCLPVTDQTSFARAVLAATQRPFEELAWVAAKASEHVHATYNIEGLRADLTAVFGGLK